MINEDKRQLLDEIADGCLLFDNPAYDMSIIGISEDGNHIIYEYNKMIRELMEEDGMSEEEAADFISYNTIRSLEYESYRNPDSAPIIIDTSWFTED